MIKQDLYMATISWDGYVDEDGKYHEDTEGEQMIARHSIDDLLEGIEEYMDKFKARSPYLECASIETYEDEKVAKWRKITESVKTILKAKEKNGK